MRTLIFFFLLLFFFSCNKKSYPDKIIYKQYHEGDTIIKNDTVWTVIMVSGD